MNLSNRKWITWAFLSSLHPANAFMFVQTSSTPVVVLKAAPQRLAENVDGVVYVNDKCINCAACANFAPSVFRRADRDEAHIVHRQPETQSEISDARAAMAACPVAAIRTETLAQKRHRVGPSSQNAVEEESRMDEQVAKQMALSPHVNGLDLPFPRPFWPNWKDLYYVGHHNEHSFGATPYLVQATVHGNRVWIMVDTPRFGTSAVRAVTNITGPTGPEYLFLTHVDDTADHDRWAREFPNLQRVFHRGDTGRYNWRGDAKLDADVEILLPQPDASTATPLYAYSVLDGTPLPADWLDDFRTDPNNDVVILHTPGHSPGSITLWKKPRGDDRPGIVFTGDSYAHTTKTGRMTGFPRFGRDLRLQAKSLQNLLALEWDVVAPGHGHPRDYSSETDKDAVRRKEMEEALVDLLK